MKCQAVLAHLTEAGGSLPGPAKAVTDHLSNCADCRCAADRLSAALTRLERTLETTSLPFDETAAVRLASAGARGPNRRSTTHESGGWIGRLGWGTAAAFAVIAVIWMSARTDSSSSNAWTPVPAVVDVEPVLSVEAPEGSRLAVFQTQNPKIAVVWLY